ncbi:MAG TPA: glycosyltransferase family A protein [Nevskiaceae bacterium]|nr:glycosyltransferase family A protein [Nevskiaceae bacterium]
MADRIRFSVLISCYNYERFVAEAIESVLAQDHPAAQILVIDDGSRDGSAALVQQRFGDRPGLSLIRRENRGQLAGFVEGARRAEGEVLCLLDADDRWQPDYLARLAAIYQSRPRVDFVYTNLRYFGEREGLFRPAGEPSRELGLSILLGAFAPRWQASATSALSLRLPLAQRVLEIPDRYWSEWRTRADDWLAAGADILGARKVYLAEALVAYRVHGANAWLRRHRDAESELRYRLRSEALLAHYRSRAGLDAAAPGQLLRHLKHEFRTWPQPDRQDLRHYLRLLDRADLPWGRRLEHRAALWAHWWHQRRLSPDRPGTGG